ncbi:MAG: restriction endonuclease subunit S [Comamonas sp.]|uniref:restriction endonuclease subunit S n=1 Tax=Comamonas sp. TaxID=34028 RepID=UPI002FCB60E3
MSRYKAYPEYKDSGLQWLGHIPTHWELVQSRRLFAQRKERARQGDEQLTASQKYGVIYQKLFMELEGQSVVQVFTGTDILKHVEKNDFVISMRSFQGGLEICGYPGCVSSAYIGLIPIKHVRPEFFRYLFKCSPYIQALQSTSNLVRDGQALRFENFSQVHLPRVPDDEQKKIAAFLSHETVKIDALIEKQQRLIELLKEKRQAVISHAVTKGLNPNAAMKDSGVEWLGEVPAHWRITQIKYVAELNPRKALVELKPSLECNFVPMEKLKTESLLLDEIRTVEEVISGYTCFCDEDILMAKVTPCFENRNIAIARGLKNGVGFGSTEIYVLRTVKHVSNSFLLYRLQENEFMRMATGTMTGAGGLKRVPTDFVNSFKFAIPPIPEQLDICSFIEKQKKRYDSLESLARNQVELLQERRTALISAAVTGKIDVRDWQAAA